MNNQNDEEVLALLDRLLERLQQMGCDQNGSHYHFVYIVAPHAPLAKGRGTASQGEVPEVLRTPEAMVLWRKAQQAGYVDEHYQPLPSRTQAALLADAMAERLGIKEKWKVFEGLWHRRNMYRDYYDAMNQDQTYLFLDKLKQLFG